MTPSEALETHHERNPRARRAFIERWARYVRTHDDATWSRQQNVLIDSQLQSANEHASTDDATVREFFERRDESPAE
ncbi:MAG: hypothetical protein ABEJ92_05030 [Halobacteriales archaeon]